MWVIATTHRPGFSRHFFEINNRTLVFRLHDQSTNQPVLLVANGSDPAQAIAEVRRLESETGLAVKHIVSPGGGPHLTLDRWHEAFTQARILLPPARIPRTANGQKLLKLPRVALLDPADPLPQVRGELDAVLFGGLFGPGDARTPYEGGGDGLLAFVGGMIHAMRTKTLADELWLHHAATGTIVAGENLAWQSPREVLRKRRSWPARC